MFEKTPEQQTQKAKEDKARIAQKQVELEAKCHKTQIYTEILEALKYASTSDQSQTLKNQVRIIDLAFKAMMQKAIHYNSAESFARAFMAQDLCRRTAATLQWMKNCTPNKTSLPLINDKQTELENHNGE